MPKSKRPKGTTKTLAVYGIPKSLMNAFSARVRLEGVTCRAAVLQLVRRVVKRDLVLEGDSVAPYADPQERTGCVFVKGVPQHLHRCFSSMMRLGGGRIRWGLIALMEGVVKGTIKLHKE